MQERVLPETFVGPSELALSLRLTAAPDVLPLDGAARSVVSVLARDERARPVAQLPLTVQIVASNELRDFGTLSARAVTTDPNGRAHFSYTAPLVSTNPAGQAHSSDAEDREPRERTGKIRGDSARAARARPPRVPRRGRLHLRAEPRHGPPGHAVQRAVL
ncbi:MAG: hypothetical protein J4F37_07620 [Acidobacteria bacterium]|nr:hypothetical protein [Acidobacteriota bacterium]